MVLSDIGYLAILLAFVLAIFGAIVGGVGAWKQSRTLILTGQRSVYANAFLLTLASGLLFYALVTHDFSLSYVVETSSRDMSVGYLLTSFWGGQAGSLLLWAWMLTVFSAVAVFRSRKRYAELVPYVAVTLLCVQIFFTFMLGFLSNPFERLPVAATDGKGLNPLLMDPGMRIHPPTLLTGYQSFAIPFAFAVAALISGRLGTEWLGAIRRWMLLSWTIQSMGLLLGMWWAYHVLGWGGYWGWDPVENAALMPWLAATAFLHSTMVQERRGMLKVWNLSLVMLSFALSIFGTFVVRSGVLSSVHAFALSSIGPFFFVFLGLIVIVSAGLIYFRLPNLQTEGQFDSVVSRESGFLVNNLLIIGVTAATFWGSIFPLISEVFRGEKITVGPPFYQQVNGPLLLALLVLMGIGPLLAWRRSTLSTLYRNLRWPVLFGLVIGAVLFLLGVRNLSAALGYGAVAFVAGTIWREFYQGTRVRARNADESWPVALGGLISRNQRRYGGYFVHIAMLLIAIGVIGSSFFQQQTSATLRKGQSVTIGSYTLTNKGVYQASQPGVRILYSDLDVRRGGRDLGSLYPTKKIYRNWDNQPVTGVAVRSVLPSMDDVYVIISDISNSGVPTYRVFINPSVSFIWYGAIFLLFGVALAAWPRGSRRATREQVRVREVVTGEA